MVRTEGKLLGTQPKFGSLNTVKRMIPVPQNDQSELTSLLCSSVHIKDAEQYEHFEQTLLFNFTGKFSHFPSLTFGGLPFCLSATSLKSSSLIRLVCPILTAGNLFSATSCLILPTDTPSFSATSFVVKYPSNI